jgi:hypothetical protein
VRALGALAPIAVALAARLAAVLSADRVVADVRIYQKVARGLLDGTWNPYELPARFYPYPPVWMWVEAGSEWLARHIPAVGFAVWVKLPILAADVLIVALLLHWGRRRGGGSRAAWLYALHPISILITGFHGQFDSIALLWLLLAVYWFTENKPDRSALALAAGIATKSFPVLLLPFFLLRSGTPRRAVRYLVLATLPGALLLVPFALDNPEALRRELFGYGGFADFGWIGLYRGLVWLRTGVLVRSEPPHWGVLVPVAKLLFLSAYALMLAGSWRGRLRWSLPQTALAVFVAFTALYGSVSVQYLTWVLPLGVLGAGWLLAAHALAGTVALVGFYAFFHPGVLFGPSAMPVYEPGQAGLVWVAGVAAVTLVSLVWFGALVRSGLRREAEAPDRRP